MKLADLLRQARRKFAEAGLPTPELDARFLLQDILHLSSADLLDGDRVFSAEELAYVEDCIARRIAGEPVSRIAGFREFYGRSFFLSPATLDPRPDTETLIEAVLEWVKRTPREHPLRILDLGTGTGCILLTLLHEIPGSTGTGIDFSPEACVTAQRNAVNQNLSDRAMILCSNWTDSLSGRFDIIVSNPPYIPSQTIPTLSPEVQNHDPILALDGGDDGLGPYKILLPRLRKFLEPGGVVFFEVGIGQAGDIARLVRDSDATLSRTHADLGGVERVLEIAYGDN